MTKRPDRAKRTRPSPSTPAPAAPTAAAAVMRAARTGRPTVYDWAHWRRAYYTTTRSLREISEQPGAPGLRQLENKSSEEDWPSLRVDYQKRTDTAADSAHTAMLLDARRDMINAGRGMMSVAMTRLAQLAQDPEQVAALSPGQMLNLMKEGADIRRKALGMDAVNVRMPKSAQELLGLPTEDLIALLAETEGVGR